jgi:hypothetical protein
MARTKHLPIYKTGYDLLQLVTQLIKNFSRDYRPTLGQRLHAECVNLVVLVYRANAAADKGPHIAAMLDSLQVVEMLLQLASDLHLISRNQYARTVPLTDGIGRQAGGWAKYTRTHGGYQSASPAA